MKRPLILLIFSLSISACGANSLLPPQQERFQVDSVPVGASVLVLGEAMGQTPMMLSSHEVFPQTFDDSRQHLYGRIELRHPGCEPFITTVSSRIISSGLKAKLECDHGLQEPPAITTPALAPEVTPLKQRLRELKAWYQEGLISEKEYDEKRRQLLEEL
jgi:hypothetical protein